ncbi:TraI/MobA(P) family conjugative relaxase [Enterobacter ludwigii]
MIVKEVKSTKASRSLKGLVKYMMDTEHEGEKVEFAQTANCYSSDISLALVEMNLVQDKNTRTRLDKTMHLVISFPEGEKPSREQLDDIEQNLAESLGMGKHQRISVAHSNTDNFHLHVAINKIDPETFKMVNPYCYLRDVSKARDALEIKHGLKITGRTTERQHSDNSVDHHSGQKSLQAWCQESLKPQVDKAIDTATHWDDIHAVFAEVGLTLNKSGRGLAVQDEKSNTTIKASSVSRQLSLATLEKKIGRFQPKKTQRTIESAYSKDKVADSLFQQYQLFREERQQSKDEALLHLKETVGKQRLLAKADNQVKRQAIKASSHSPAQKRQIYKRLAENNRQKSQAITGSYAADRKKIYEQHGNMTFQQFLCHTAANGNEEALAKLRREAQKAIKHQGLSGEGDKRVTAFDAVQVDKHGVIAYKVGKHTILDNGKVLAGKDSSLTADKQLLEMAVAKYGRNLTLNGSDAFKARILSAAEQLNIDVVLNGQTVGDKDPVQQFIDNRNRDRVQNKQIQYHERLDKQQGVFAYQGYRNVGQQTVVLLKQGHTLYVKEIPKKELVQYRALKVGAIIDTRSEQIAAREDKGRDIGID